jgi:hypothetical protein
VPGAARARCPAAGRPGRTRPSARCRPNRTTPPPRPGRPGPHAPARPDSRAGRLPPDGPGRSGAGAVAHHHDRVLPASPGPGHGDRAGAHAAGRHRGRGHAGQPDRTTDDPAVPVRIRQGPGGTRPQAARRRPGPVRSAGPGRSRPRTAAPRWDQETRSRACTAIDGPGPRGWPEACCVGEASVTAYVAQCRSQGLQRYLQPQLRCL